MNKEELEDYLEVYYEIALVVGILSDSKYSNIINDIYREKSRDGLYEVTKNLTDEFHKIHKDTLWGKNENTLFFDTLEEFIDENL